MTSGNKDHNIGFEVLFDHATTGILLADDQGNILLANPFLLQQFGYTAGEITGEPVKKLLPLYCSAATTSQELLAIRSNGSEFPAEVNLSAHANNKGHFVIAFVTDISDRKANENALEQLKLRVREAEVKDSTLQRMNSFLNSIWNNADAIIIVVSPEGYIKWFNPTAEKTLGYKATEVIDIYSALIFHDPEEIAKRAEEFSRQLQQPVEAGLETLTIKAQLDLPNEYEWWYIRKDGSRLPVSLTVSTIRDATTITGYVGIAIDISKRKSAETELRSALEKEKELNELKSRFVSLASHEFRTPLSTILSSTYLISKFDHTADQPRRAKHIRRIISSVNMLTDILNDFLSVGKIEEGKIHVRTATFETGKHIGTIISEMQGLQKKSQNIYYAHHGNPTARLDPTLLKHIVMNLVSNAIKFSPEGAVISVRTQCNNDGLVLSVKDKGIGISEEDRPYLFERFFRGANATHIQGTGLGLHIVARYAELMNGTVTCNSSIGAGTEFIVSLPFPKN
ncbi:sensor histidine kinase [Chitinophaga vietnamensis]|uniref:sensor histidine kinase n=1 Tax=Chitinophaga vietnamensis TaxID=2593957 RepID=UPI001177DE54|nr:PAS domain S-box protein [Chitinophaga vietnamensis]